MSDRVTWYAPNEVQNQPLMQLHAVEDSEVLAHPAVVALTRHAEWMALDIKRTCEVHTPGIACPCVDFNCPVAAYRVGTRVFATQHHPEMTPDFAAALVEELSPHFPPEVGEADTF